MSHTRENRRTVNIEFYLALACAMARFAFCCYRAWRQAITIDEATTCNTYVSGPWSLLAAPYDVNNHVLFTICAKLSVLAFGISEFTLRLPSVLAGLLLILGVFDLLQQTVRSPSLRWAAFIAVCLHPLMLDFSIAARGYGMSEAFFVWAVCYALRKRYVASGLLLGLAASAHLSIVIPSLALILTVTCLEYRDCRRVPVKMTASAFALFAVICFASMRSAQRGDFTLGFPTLRQTLLHLIWSSIRAMTGPGLFGTSRGLEIIATFLAPALALISIAFSLRLLGDPAARVRLVPLVTLAVTLGGIVVAHFLFSLPYPVDRAALFAVPLGAAMWAVSGDSSNHSVVRLVWLLPFVVFALQCVTQLQTRAFVSWPWAMDNREIAGLLRERTAQRPPASVSVSTNWTMQSEMEFYRRYYHIRALRPIERHVPTLLSGFDFYVLNTAFDDVDGLRVVFADPWAQVVVATR